MNEEGDYFLRSFSTNVSDSDNLDALGMREELSLLTLRMRRIEMELKITGDDRSRGKLEVENSDGKDKSRNKDAKDSFNVSQVQKSYFADLFSTIGLPGLRYVASTEPTLHRIIWFCIHFIALFVSYIHIQDFYDKWQSSTVVESLAFTNVVDIPLPAVTFCMPLTLNKDYNQTKILESCVNRRNRSMWICGEEDFKLFRISSEIKPIHSKTLIGELSIVYYNLTIGYRSQCLLEKKNGVVRCLPTQWNSSMSGMEYIKYVHELVDNLSLPPLLFRAHGNGIINLRISNTSIMTLEGKLAKCQTLNGISHRVSNNKMIPFNANFPDYGLNRSSTCNLDKLFKEDCKNELAYNKDLYIEFDDFPMFHGNELSELYVFIHNPADYPTGAYMYSSTTIFHLNQGDYVSLYLNPNLSNAKTDLIELAVSKRNCLFAFERKLSLFEFYTQRNCIFDCQINCAIKLCGCVPLEIAIFNSSFNICTYQESLDCQEKTEIRIFLTTCPSMCHCDCPPDCVSLTYDFSSTRNSGMGITYMSLLYKKPTFISVYKYSPTSLAEFLAYSLGILGMYNGFSLIVVWEILYWLTFRLWYSIKRNEQY